MLEISGKSRDVSAAVKAIAILKKGKKPDFTEPDTEPSPGAGVYPVRNKKSKISVISNGICSLNLYFFQILC